jgi:tripartite-type tricarboxylate transporter receptor subunit TctC
MKMLEISWTRAINALVAAIVLGATASAGAADEFPSRAVNIVVPFTAGGPSDTAARLFADVLRRELGQSVIIENRPGASGIPGTESVLQAPPDGHTLLLGGLAPLILIPPIQKVRYDLAKDFVPLALIWRSPQVFALSTKLGLKTVAETVSYGKAHPGKITIGSAGIGTVTHLAGELFKREAGIELTHVPYKSTVNSLSDLVGGHIDAIFGDVAILKPQVQAGSIQALAITAPERSPLLPDLITMTEAGFPNVRTEVWYGILASARTPPQILQRLKTATANVQKDPEYRAGLEKHGIHIQQAGQDGFASFVREEADRWTPIVLANKAN